MFPYLEILRAQGDPDLSRCTEEEGRRICDRIFAMHSWRRGAHTFAEQYWPGINLRKAREIETDEHARWVQRRSGARAAMHQHYREWNLAQRLRITFFCM